MELFAADGHDAGGCERVTGKSGMRPVLGLREGATETAAVTTGLLSDLVTRGLPTDRTLLFVIDGATGLRRANSVERYTRRVKRWRGGQMIQRWATSALVEAEPRFRRVRGYRDLRYLVGALDALAPPDGAVADVV